MTTAGIGTKRRARWTRRLLLAGAILWCAAILAAPLAMLEPIYSFFAAICHQIPERSWLIGGTPLAVCIRCTSIYFGFFIAVAIRIPASPRLLKTALAVTIIEFLFAQAGFDYGSARATTGLLLGLAAAGFVEAGISELFRSRFRRFQERTSPS